MKRKVTYGEIERREENELVIIRPSKTPPAVCVADVSLSAADGCTFKLSTTENRVVSKDVAQK